MKALLARLLFRGWLEGFSKAAKTRAVVPPMVYHIEQKLREIGNKAYERGERETYYEPTPYEWGLLDSDRPTPFLGARYSVNVYQTDFATIFLQRPEKICAECFDLDRRGQRFATAAP